MSDQNEQVVVVGGGVIGAMSAWHLCRKGYRVVIVDRDRFGAACSHGNCGYVCPSHALPLAAPGAIRGALPYLFKRNAPLSIRWRFSPALWKWLWKFARHCNRTDWLASGEACYSILASSAALYASMIEEENIDCEWETRGLLFVYDRHEEFEEYGETDKLLRDKFDLAATPYDGDALVELEPALKRGLGGAWHYEGDAHLRPDKLMSELRRLLEANGVKILEQREVSGFQSEGKHAKSIMIDGENLEADKIVVATGAWSPYLNRELGCRIPIQPGKGYTITMPHPTQCPKIPMVLERHRVAITPMRTGYRIGSTMEFAGYDTSIRPERLNLLCDSAKMYLHDAVAEPQQETWYGWRPMTWDGKPIIDRTPKYENVWVAAGHNMLGLSMAPATGKLVAESVAGEPPHLDLAPFSIARFN